MSLNSFSVCPSISLCHCSSVCAKAIIFKSQQCRKEERISLFLFFYFSSFFILFYAVSYVRDLRMGEAFFKSEESLAQWFEKPLNVCSPFVFRRSSWSYVRTYVRMCVTSMTNRFGMRNRDTRRKLQTLARMRVHGAKARHFSSILCGSIEIE